MSSGGVLRKFPYREEGTPPILRPTLDVRLAHADLEWSFRALVDTGAPVTFFDYAAAEALCIDLTRSDARRGRLTILGGDWDAVFEYVDICLVDDRIYQWQAEVAFVTNPSLRMPFQGVLGTEGFLDKFAVTFDKYYDYFVIERPDNYHERRGRHLEDDLMRVEDPEWSPPA